MYCFDKPLLDCISFILLPKVLHEIWSSLWDKSVLVDLLPKLGLVELLIVISTHDFKELKSLYNSELLLLAYVKLLTIMIVSCRCKDAVILELQHFVTAYFHWPIFVFFNASRDPLLVVNCSLVEVLHLEHDTFWSNLECEAL